MGKLRKEIANSPSWMSLRQGGDNISRKARIVTSAIADRELKTVVNDANPVLLFRFDGEGWERWSVVGGGFEPVDGPLPPLRTYLEDGDETPSPGDRYRVDEGTWRRLAADEPDPAG